MRMFDDGRKRRFCGNSYLSMAVEICATTEGPIPSAGSPGAASRLSLWTRISGQSMPTTSLLLCAICNSREGDASRGLYRSEDAGRDAKLGRRAGVSGLLFVV